MLLLGARYGLGIPVGVCLNVCAHDINNYYNKLIKYNIMNYPEELRERWNDCMYDERDIIQRFLEKQYDIRYGHQRDTWHFEPAVRLIGTYGCEIAVTDAHLDKNKFVTFTGVCCNERNDDYECTDFAYGELSKVIEALPDADDIVMKNAVNDLSEFSVNLRCDLILQESPFVYKGIKVDNVLKDDEGVHICVGERAIADEHYDADFLSKLRDHIHIEHLHRTDEYKEVMERLSLLENMRLEFDSPNVVMFDIKSTDMKVDILSVQRDDTRLSMRVMCVDDGEVLTLEEKDVFKEYLYDLAKWMKMWVSKYCDIMDTYNAHNPELVRKINAAWRDDKYHDSFENILFALAMRDEEEIGDKFGDLCIHDSDDAMKFAHEIMEGVCDDLDLETILSFIRYKE